MIIAFSILLGVLVLFVLFFALVHPLMCIVDCALSKEHTGGAKLIWILATLVAGFIPAIIYTLVGTNSNWLRKIMRGAVGAAVLCVVLLAGIAFASPEVREFVTAGTQSQAGAALNSVVDMSEFEAAMEDFGQQIDQLETQSTSSGLFSAQNDTEIPAGHAIATTLSNSGTGSDGSQARLSSDETLAVEETAGLSLLTQGLASVMEKIRGVPTGGAQAEPVANSSRPSDSRVQHAKPSPAPQQRRVNPDNQRLVSRPPVDAQPSRTADSGTAEVKAGAFNRYRGTSQPLMLDYEVPAVGNRYTNP